MRVRRWGSILQLRRTGCTDDQFNFMLSMVCSATSKQTKKRAKCRFHGAGDDTRGLCTQEAKAERWLVSGLLKQSRKIIVSIS
jgi:hypothetical protein